MGELPDTTVSLAQLREETRCFCSVWTWGTLRGGEEMAWLFPAKRDFPESHKSERQNQLALMELLLRKTAEESS